MWSMYLRSTTMAKINLTQNKTALVDREDVKRILRFKWHYLKIGYAASKSCPSLYMHRFIMNAPKGLVVDHINGNTLDNRKKNLRVVTHSFNLLHHVRLQKRNTSGIAGVSWHKKAQKWSANKQLNKENVYLGLFLSKEEAQRTIKGYGRTA